MKKSLRMLGVFLCFLLFAAVVLYENEKAVQFEIADNQVILKVKSGKDTMIIRPQSGEDDIMYFVLPSFVENNNIYADNIERGMLCIDDETITQRSCFQWDSEVIYHLTYAEQTLQVVFVQSANLPTLFIDTQSGTMEYLDADKNHAEQGTIKVVSATGNVEYADTLAKISERGNSTFVVPKRSYAITLRESYPLCGLEAGKKWNLLSMYYEHDKMHSKIVYDMGQYLQSDYAPDSTWVDLYCNGVYKGLFLLTDSITVGKNRVEIEDLEKENEKVNPEVDLDTLLPAREEKMAYYEIENPTDITGGFLIEKELPEFLKPEEAFFTTEKCNYTFVVKAPKHASKEQVEYIAEFVQKIEDSFVSGTEEYKKYIDLDSFAKQFLIDQIVLEPDAMRMSTFFYKEKDSDILHSGPIWDYDRAMGENCPSYTLRIEEKPGEMKEWYLPLYQDEEFFEKIQSNFEKLLPYMNGLLESGIDDYVQKIAQAVHIDMDIFQQYMFDDTRSYREYDNYIRYLKYFLANRLNYLIALWDIPYEPFAVEEGNGTLHTVTFMSDEETVYAECEILDGACLETLPVLHDAEAFAWRYMETDKFYNTQTPIYEDTVLIERTKDNKSYQEYKIESLQTETELARYMDMLESDEAFSYLLYEKQESCLLVIDNGLHEKTEADLKEETGELHTTFGVLCYGTDENGKQYMTIQDIIYEDLYTAVKDTLLIVVKKSEGSIVDVVNFETGIRIVE